MTKRLPPDVLMYFRQQGEKGGRIGGKITAARMTPEERIERARKGGRARAKKAKKAKAKRAKD